MRYDYTILYNFQNNLHAMYLSMDGRKNKVDKPTELTPNPSLFERLDNFERQIRFDAV